MRIGHTAVHRGKRVLVILRSGERFEDVFEERTDRSVRLRGHGWLAKKELRALSLLKTRGGAR